MQLTSLARPPDNRRRWLRRPTAPQTECQPTTSRPRQGTCTHGTVAALLRSFILTPSTLGLCALRRGARKAPGDVLCRPQRRQRQPHVPEPLQARRAAALHLRRYAHARQCRTVAHRRQTCSRCPALHGGGCPRRHDHWGGPTLAPGAEARRAGRLHRAAPAHAAGRTARPLLQDAPAGLGRTPGHVAAAIVRCAPRRRRRRRLPNPSRGA